jgi:hypothetical protein
MTDKNKALPPWLDSGDPNRHVEMTPKAPPLPVAGSWAGFLGGILLVGLPSLVTQALWPNWMTLSGSEADKAGAVWLVLLSASGLVIFATAAWLSMSRGVDSAQLLLLRIHAGVAVGTWLSVLVLGQNSYDVGAAAALFAILIGIPFWFCAGLGLAVGMGVNRRRTPPE